MNMDYCDIPPIRKLFYFFNTIFTASGICLIIVGSVVTSRLSSSAASSFLPLAVLAPPAFMIALGALSLCCVVFSLPLCRGRKESKVPGGGRWKDTVKFTSGRNGRAILYATVVSIVAFAELVTGSVSLSTRKHYNRALREAMEDSLYIYPNDSSARNEWDTMQQKLQCCGVFNPGEWLGHPLMSQLPPSCCHVESTEQQQQSPNNQKEEEGGGEPGNGLNGLGGAAVGGGRGIETAERQNQRPPLHPTCSFLWGHDVFHSGCFRKIRKVVDSATVTIGGVSVAMGFVKLLMGIFGLLLARAAVKRYSRV